MTALLFTLGLALAAPATPSDSLYQVHGAFEDQSGKRVDLDVARGGPVLLAMFYATCPKACPMLISDVKGVLSQLTDAERQRLRVVLVSLDPDRDTPALLQKVTQERALDAQWTLLRTDKTTTRTLAGALGVRYRDNGDGSIEHTSKIVLLDGQGVIAATRDAIGSDNGTFVKDVRAHLARAPSPSASVPAETATNPTRKK